MGYWGLFLFHSVRLFFCASVRSVDMLVLLDPALHVLLEERGEVEQRDSEDDSDVASRLAHHLRELVQVLLLRDHHQLREQEDDAGAGLKGRREEVK